MSTVAECARIAEIDEVKIPEPLWSVKSRVSWGALLAGAVVAIALYSLLSMLGVALAVTLSERMDAEQLGRFAAVWTFATLLVGMLAGGFTSTRCTAGEFRNEGILYGIIVWGVASLVLIPLSAAGIGASVGTVLASRGIATANNEISPAIISAQHAVSTKIEEMKDTFTDSEHRRSGRDDASSKLATTSSDDKSESDNSSTTDGKTAGREETSASRSSDSEARTNSASDRSSDRSQRDVSRSSTSSENRHNASNTDSKSARENVASASWWAFGGTFASMLMAILGAMLGPSITVVHHKLPLARAPLTSVRPIG